MKYTRVSRFRVHEERRPCRPVSHWAGWPLLVMVLVAAPSPGKAQVLTRSVPSDEYYRVFNTYLNGDFERARKEFSRVSRLKSPAGEWIDSIPYHTMLGECLYNMGNLSAAMDQYNAALNVFLAYPTWMLGLQLKPLPPRPRAVRYPPTWGPGSRVIRVAQIPDRMASVQGKTPNDNLRALREGGVMAQQYYLMVDAREIVRCTALAVRRRGEILGKVGPYDDMTKGVIAALANRPTAPRHWSQAWISAQLGLAYAARGDTAQAIEELNRSLLVGGMDHMLTATSLMTLGKLAFRARNYQQAAGYFLDASCSAAALASEDYTQYEVIAEAFRWGLAAHLAQGARGPYPPLTPAAAWSRRAPRLLQSSVSLLLAENYAAINETKQAGSMLDRTARAMQRGEFREGQLGARHGFVSAQVSFQKGDTSRGTMALAKVLRFQRAASTRLFQIALSDRLVTSEAITPRQATLLYADVLRDPTPDDWVEDPLESLSVLATPHPLPYEHWMQIVLARKEHDAAMRISDQLRRHRFYSSLPLGGRVLNLRWMLEAPPQVLSQPALLRRQAFLDRHPEYAQLSKQAAAVRQSLVAVTGGGAEDDPDKLRLQAKLYNDLAKIGIAQEKTLDAIAVGREPSEVVFPPPTDVTNVQTELTEGQRVLVFISTRMATYAFLLGGEKYSAWQLESPVELKSNIAKLLREMGQFDRNQILRSKELADETWKDTAETILNQLTGNAPASNWDGIRELIVVPDGMLWYLPFEALQLRDGDRREALIDKVQIRYAPTISLSVPGNVPRKRSGRTAVVTGPLSPKSGESESLELLADLRSDDARVFAVPTKPVPPSAIFTTAVDRLIVLRDLANDTGGPYDWAPMDLDRGRPGGSLAQWMALPWGAPDQIVLPGFHTPAEIGLKRGGDGSDVFLQVCGLMATGSRTVLLSRWRDGGRSSYDLVREFVRELPHRSAAAAWQRSVHLVVNSDLDLDHEPRINVTDRKEGWKAEHPFFWAGYMLIDTGARVKTDEGRP